MKKITMFIAAMLFSFSAQAAVVFDSSTGLETTFGWSGLAIGGTIESYETTVAGPSEMDIFLDDCCVVGDVFELWLDGTMLTPSFSGGGAGTETWYGDYLGVSLSAGTHTFDIKLAADCCGAGGAYVDFYAASAVPEPATWLMLILGFGMVGVATRRRRVTALV